MTTGFTTTLRERSEVVMLLVILAISVSLFVGSFQFSKEAAQFPRITSGVTILGVLLLLGRNYLPDPLEQFVGESVDLVSGEEDFEDKRTDSTSETRTATRTRPMDDSLFTAILALGYVGLGYMIGLLWASPIFVVVYGLWFDLSKYVTAFLAGITFVIAFLFMAILNLQLATGAVL